MLPTGSGIDRPMVCPASAALPQVRNVGGHASAVGTHVHGFVNDVRKRAEDLADDFTGAEVYAAAIEQAREEQLAALRSRLAHVEADERRDALTLAESIDFAILPRGAEGEVTLAYDWRTRLARILGKDLGRDYGAAAPTEYVGTADLLGVVEGRIFLADFKTGRKVYGAREAWQLRLLALAACRAAGVGEAEVMMVYLRSDGRVYVDRATFDVFDLAGFAGQLAQLAERIDRTRQVIDAGRIPDVVEGPHCRYCPALPACPAKVALVDVIARRLETDHQDGINADGIRRRIAEMPADAVGRAWATWLEPARELVRVVGEAIEARAREEPIPLPDGRELRGVPTSRRYLDGEIAAQVLEQIDPALARESIDWSPDVSRASIVRGLRKVQRRPKEADGIIEQIERAGGVQRRQSLPVRAVKRDEALPEPAQDVGAK